MASVVAVGTFDGVHLGHMALMQAVVERARVGGARAVALTFDPPPRLVLRPDAPYRTLISLAERLEYLRATGLDEVAVQPFSLELASWSAGRFMKMLRDRFGMVEIVGGPDLALGHGREGTIPVLREMGARMGFAVTVVEQRLAGSVPVRSGEIRRRVLSGDVSGAALLLGRAPTIEGTVVHGDHRGRTIGVPTANLALPRERIVPGPGVYAVRCVVDRGVRDAVANIGTRPTVGGSHLSIEVHLLDYTGDLYGTVLRAQLVERLRDEQRFPSLDALIAQIARDVEAARCALR